MLLLKNTFSKGQSGLVNSPNETQTIRSLLARRLPEMRPAEQRVASFLLYEGSNTLDWRLEELAARAGASPSAVVRMCHALGFDGFRTFRDQWILELSSPPTQDGAIRRDHPLWTAFEALLQTTELIDPALLVKAGELVRAAETVMV